MATDHFAANMRAAYGAAATPEAIEAARNAWAFGTTDDYVAILDKVEARATPASGARVESLYSEERAVRIARGGGSLESRD